NGEADFVVRMSQGLAERRDLGSASAKHAAAAGGKTGESVGAGVVARARLVQSRRHLGIAPGLVDAERTNHVRELPAAVVVSARAGRRREEGKTGARAARAGVADAETGQVADQVTTTTADPDRVAVRTRATVLEREAGGDAVAELRRIGDAVDAGRARVTR